MAAGSSPAADSFVGSYGGVCFGLTNASGPEQHYSYWAEYDVDDVTGMVTGTGQMSRQGGATPPAPLSVSNTYRVFRREGVLMGLEGTRENRVHGRLSDNLEYGIFTRLYDNNEWYLAMIAATYSGVPIDGSYLNGDYWYVRYGLTHPSGGSESHECEYGSETYDGVNQVSYDFQRNSQADGMIDGWGDANYYVAVDGALARYVDQEMGFVLDNGLLLATSLVNSDETWRITLSVRKPTGAMSLASLQGPYWLIRYQYNNVGGADQHAISLGEAYFDGAGGLDAWITLNVKGYGAVAGFTEQTYTVGADGAFSLGSFAGGVGIYGRVILAAQATTADKWGVMVLLKQSGIEDPSPICHLLGLAP